MATDLNDISAGISQAVKRASGYTVGVDGRGGYPSSGVVYAANLVLSADHSVEREGDIQILMAGGSKPSAKVVGRDYLSDLVLLELEEGKGSERYCANI